MLFLSGICQTSNILKILFSILVIIKVAFIVVPIVLIVIIIINFLKSIIIKDNIIGKKLHIAIKKIIICLGIFFIPTVIESTTKLVNKAGINFSVPYGECIENASLSKIAEIEKYEVALKAKEEIITENNELIKQSSVDEKKVGENATENENITDENSNTNDINNTPTPNTANSNNSTDNTSDTSTITNDTSTNIPDNNTISSNNSISTITTTDTSTTITNDTNTTNSNNTTNNTPDINTSSSDNSTSITPDTSIPSNNNNTNNINNNNNTNTDIPNNNNTTNSSNNNSSTNNTNNSNQNNKINAEAFLNSLDKMSTIVEKDYKKGKIWHYSNAHIESTFEKERKNGRETNCAQYVSWALVDIGVLEGQSIYKAYSDGKNEIKGSGANKIQNSKKVKIINANAKTPKELEQEGRLKPGDIMLWYNVQHTNVYAGNKKFYDAGHAGSNGCTSSHEYFKTWGPVKTSYYNNWKVWKIIRVKG